jgi:hypothetical protein
VPNTYQLPSTRIAPHYIGICDDSRSLDEIKGNRANAKILESFRETRRMLSVDIHQSLRVPPTMAAGVSDMLWSLEDIVRIVDEWGANHKM